MLLPTMNRIELTKELQKDHFYLLSKTVPRLMNDYERERRRNKVQKTEEYTKAYTVKTSSKNHWTIQISKDITSKIFNSNTVNVVMYTYYITPLGLRVFELSEKGSMVFAYNGHLFKRYNERMGLNLTSTLEAAKHFFTRNSNRMGKMVEDDGKKFLIEMCSDGIVFSEIQGDWVVSKTFIDQSLAKEEQTDLEKRMMKAIENTVKDSEGREKQNLSLKEKELSVLLKKLSEKYER